jgi:hypothetical protein
MHFLGQHRILKFWGVDGITALSNHYKPPIFGIHKNYNVEILIENY